MTTVIEVDEQERQYLPIGKFVNGKVNHKHAGDLNCRLLSRADMSDIRTQDQKIMVSETQHMTYTGRNFGPSTLNHAKGLMKYYVGVYDEKTGKMKICDTEVFNMQPHNPAQEMDAMDTAESNLDKNKLYSEKLDSLTSAFGSTKRKRAMESKHRLKVGDSELKGVLDTAVDHGLKQANAYKKKQDEMVDDPSLSSTPPCNKDAKNVEDVYRLSDIITDSEMESMQHCAAEFFNCDIKKIAEWRKAETYPAYILNHLETMPISEGPRWRRSKCLIYLSYMLQLNNLRAKELAKRFPLPGDLPVNLKQKLMDAFTMSVQVDNKSKRCIPTRMKDRLASYVLTLCLLIDEFSLELELIQSHLRINSSKMEQHAKGLGCKVVRNYEEDGKVVTIATLKLPLSFPSKFKMKKR